jgi:hypothetical protein
MTNSILSGLLDAGIFGSGTLGDLVHIQRRPVV